MAPHPRQCPQKCTEIGRNLFCKSTMSKRKSTEEKWHESERQKFPISSTNDQIPGASGVCSSHGEARDLLPRRRRLRPCFVQDEKTRSSEKSTERIRSWGSQLMEFVGRKRRPKWFVRRRSRPKGFVCWGIRLKGFVRYGTPFDSLPVPCPNDAILH